MYKDLISYELAEEVSEEKLLNVAGRIVKEWMAELDGFISWEICKDTEGKYTDVVCWDSKEDAKNAEKVMGKIPNAAEWYACYKEGTISSSNLSTVRKF